MFRFFRKLRQQLLSENRLRRYGGYALGEMVLVTLGILIALQINNWNEKRKSLQQGKEMVLEIKAGLESDMGQLDQFVYFHHHVLESQDVITRWLGNEAPWSDTLAKHLSRVYRALDFQVNYSGYETLKQFGLRRIEDDSLRLSITNLYEVEYPVFIKYTAIHQKFLESVLENNPLHFNELNYTGPTMRPLNVEILKADTEYAYNLRTLMNVNQLMIYQAQQLKGQIKETYDIIASQRD